MEQWLCLCSIAWASRVKHAFEVDALLTRTVVGSGARMEKWDGDHRMKSKRGTWAKIADKVKRGAKTIQQYLVKERIIEGRRSLVHKQDCHGWRSGGGFTECLLQNEPGMAWKNPGGCRRKKDGD